MDPVDETPSERSSTVVDVGKLSDEPWLETPRDPITIQELRAACELVARCYADLAETMTPAGELTATADRTYELGRALTEFGMLCGRYWGDAFDRRT